MKSFIKILPYLLLNIIISAATILAVLFLWDRYSSRFDAPPVCPTPNAAVTPLVPAVEAATQAFTTAPQPSTTATKPLVLRIDTVVGAGDLATEAVKIRMESGGPVDLTGWQLMGEHLMEPYIFPSYTLRAGGTVQIHTGAGTSSVSDLYWGNNLSAWYSGTVVRLVDAKGTERANYTVP